MVRPAGGRHHAPDERRGGPGGRPLSGFFGELYVRSTLPFLTPSFTRREVDYLSEAFASLAIDGPILDAGCGHGRHAAPLSRRHPSRAWIGLDFDLPSLREGEAGHHRVQGDLRALPLSEDSLAGAFAWYSTLFVFDEPEARLVLGELRRCLRPGGRLVLQTVPYERMLKAPTARFEGRLPDGSLLKEESRFDAKLLRDCSTRELTLPDGRVLSGQFFIRYYPLPSLRALLEGEGFEVAWVHGGLAGEPFHPDAEVIILGAEKKRVDSDG